MSKKKVFVTALMVCLIATLSMGSLAWFSASDSVTNKFMIASSAAPGVPPTGDNVFSVDVWEYTENSPTEKVPTGDTFNNILPGDVLKKEPHVANTGAYDQYIRVVVTVSDASAWKTVFNKNVVELTDLVTGYDSTMWSPVGTNEIVEDDTFQYVLYYTGKLAAGNDIKVFEQVAIPDSMTQDQAAAFGADGFDIVVVAQAVQTENVGASAYEAFRTVGMGLQ